MTIPDSPRRRIVHFRLPFSEQEQDLLQSAILLIEGTLKVEISEMRLIVEYGFPACDFSKIWQLLEKLVDPERVGLIERFGQSLAGFSEQNERDHILFSCHWHSYVKAIYVYYHNFRSDNTEHSHKHLWRRYK